MGDVNLIKEILHAYEEERSAVLVTVIACDPATFIGAKTIIQFPNVECHQFIGDTLPVWLASTHPSAMNQIVQVARDLIQKEEHQMTSLLIESESLAIRVILELIHREPKLIICGAGHVGQALAPMARLLNFEVIVIDDRADYASPDLFPEDVCVIAKPYTEAFKSVTIMPSTRIVVVTRGHRHDESCLRILLNSSALYIGMIGSRKRVITVFRRLLSEGYSLEAVQRIRAPIGLDIGARTPAELAVAILAEVILVKYGGTGAPKHNQVKHEVHFKMD